MTLTDQDLKIVIISMILLFRGEKENISITWREIEDVKIRQVELLEIKTMSKVKSSADRIDSR